MTKFSIIVPVYKVEPYIRQCIDSLLAQSYNNFEIIIVDDGSPDNCPQICDEYSKKYSNIKTIHKPNGGLSDARNKGLEIAQGEYITFVDSDDFWLNKNILTDINNIIEKYTPDLIIGDCIKHYTQTNQNLYPDTPMSSKYNGREKIEILKYLYYELADLKMAAWQKFVSRKKIKDTSFTLNLLSEDIDWSLQLYPLVDKICIYDTPYYCYRQQREGSITETASQRSFDCLIDIIQKWRTMIPQMKVSDKEKEIYNGYLAYQLSIAIQLANRLDQENKKDAFKEIKKHINLFKYPLNYKTKKVYCLISIFGLQLTSKILRLFINVRHKLNQSK